MGIFTPITRAYREKIEEVLKNYEPRVNLQNVAVDDDQDRNRLLVNIYFYVRGILTILTNGFNILTRLDKMANGKISVSELDFNLIKTNLRKLFYKVNQRFKIMTLKVVH